MPRLKNKNIISTKWVFWNKLKKEGKILRNKAILVCKGYVQVGRMDFKETFALVTRLEVIRIFIALAMYKNFKVHQMDIKSTFLNGNMEEEVYIEQLNGFQLVKDSNMVGKLKKALYSLKKAPQAWYSRLDNYLL